MPAPASSSSRRRSAAAVTAAGTTLALWSSLSRAQSPPTASGPSTPLITQQPQGDAPGSSPPGPARIVDFEGRDGKWAWLTTTGGPQIDAWNGHAAGTGKIASGQGWKEISRDGETVWLLSADSLLRVTGGAATPVDTGLSQPGGLRADEGKVYWIETRDAVPGGWSFVPSTGPVSRLRIREGDSPPRDLAEWPGATAGPGDILGFTADAAYVRVRRALSTEFLRVPLAGGAPVRLGTEGGAQEAVLHNGTLWWTAPSEEAMPTATQFCVRGENGATLTDWLPGNGHLMVLNGSLQYAINAMYRIPTGSRTPKAPEYLGKVPGGVIGDDGRTAILLSGLQALTPVQPVRE